MLFDPHTYSPLWVTDFFLSPMANPDRETAPLRLKTSGSLGYLADPDNRWRLEPGLGSDFEISSVLLLHCGFRLTFPNEQVYELLHPAPGLWVGRLPARAKPELFAMDQTCDMEEDTAFLAFDDCVIGLQTRREDGVCALTLAVAGDRNACRQRLQAASGLEPAGLWSAPLAACERGCHALPEGFFAENPGLPLERLQGMIAAPVDGFPGPWICDPASVKPEMTLSMARQVIPAIAVTQPDTAAQLVNTLFALPDWDGGGWAEVYLPGDGIDSPRGPAQPGIAAMLAQLPPQTLKQLDRPRLVGRIKAQLDFFLSDASPLPQWPRADTAFTPEITDPGQLQQFDLTALLILDIEAVQQWSGDANWMADTCRKLRKQLIDQFWDAKRKRFLDKIAEGDFAARLTAATLIPLLWADLDKPAAQALRQCLLAGDELRSGHGIRQWQPRKDDPIPPPVLPGTQHLFLPLLGKLPGESAALLSADWHRLLDQDAAFRHPGSAALWARLIPYAGHINPHLERYPAWVRSLEKHRQTLVSVIAVILLLIPAGFGIYFTLRSDYNLSDEQLEAGHAETLVTMGNLEKAEEVYTRLLTHSRKGGRQQQYYLNRGNIRFKLADYEGAREDYLQAIALDPPGALFKARWNLGQTYARLGQTDEAVATLRGFIDEYGEELPSYREMAENAISLWQR